MLAIWKTTWKLFVTALPFKLVNDGATFIGPVFLNLLLGVVSSGQSSALGYSYAALMFVGLILGTLCDNQHFQRVMRAGARLLPALASVCERSASGMLWRLRAPVSDMVVPFRYFACNVL